MIEGRADRVKMEAPVVHQTGSLISLRDFFHAFWYGKAAAEGYSHKQLRSRTSSGTRNSGHSRVSGEFRRERRTLECACAEHQRRWRGSPLFCVILVPIESISSSHVQSMRGKRHISNVAFYFVQARTGLFNNIAEFGIIKSTG